MKSTLVPGVKTEVRHVVTRDNLLSAIYPDAPPVFATPWLLCIMETAAAEAILPHLDKGEASVGVGFDFQHLAPTPEGATVVATAEVTNVERNLVTLHIEARDPVEVVSRGTHMRAVIDMDRFLRRVARKQDPPRSEV